MVTIAATNRYDHDLSLHQISKLLVMIVIDESNGLSTERIINSNIFDLVILWN